MKSAAMMAKWKRSERLDEETALEGQCLFFLRENKLRWIELV